MFEWIWQLLYYLGFWQKKATIILLGLDNAGKTTLLFKLKNNTISSFIPTQRAQMETIELGHITFKAWDLGGHEAVRDLWKDYYVEADAVIFLVDSADSARFGEAKIVLNELLTSFGLATTPFLILGNKSDVNTAVNRETLMSVLNIQKNQLGTSSELDRPMQVFTCSLVAGTGFTEALKWLANIL